MSDPAPLRSRAPAARFDDRLLAIFDSERPGETIDGAYRRREHELLAAFGELSIRDALELHRRLCTAHPDDLVATRFARLIVPRRIRLLEFLLDARRRAVVAAGRR